MKNVAFYIILEIDDFIISIGKTNLNNLILIIHTFKLNDNSYIFTGDKGDIKKTNSDN